MRDLGPEELLFTDRTGARADLQDVIYDGLDVDYRDRYPALLHLLRAQTASLIGALAPIDDDHATSAAEALLVQVGRWTPAVNEVASALGHHRQILNGILFRVRTGIPWRDLPERYGPWQTVYERFTRWQTDGTWTRVEACLRTQADAAGELDWDAQIDSTVVRAHQHAAGARKRGTRRSRQAASKRWAVTGWASQRAGTR